MLALLPPLPPADLKIDFRPREGLVATLDGVPVIQGSSVQLFGADGEGRYSSRWTDSRATRMPDGFHVDWTAPDATGTIDLSVLRGVLTIRHRIVGTGEAPLKAEIANLLYAEPWRNAVQTPAVPRDRPARKPNEIEGRLLARGSGVRLESRRAALGIEGAPGLIVFDGDGYAADWARGTSRYWSGYDGLPVTKDTPLDLTTTYRFEGGFAGGTTKMALRLAAKSLPNAIKPVEARLPLIPKPLKVELDYGKPLEITGAWSFPAGRPRRLDDFWAALARRFELVAPTSTTRKVTVDGGIHDFKLVPGAYEITIRPQSLTILGQDDEGVLSAVERLASLAFVRDGKVYVPTGVLRDGPRRDFRGVHLFVGPNATTFHQRLWSRVLRPLGLNTVVLQCERTAWDALPGLRGAGVMAKADLASLVKWYRTRTVEPIPLIQSYGHMEWLFAGGADRNLALDPATLYAIDLRKPESQALVNRIWDEAIATVRPGTLHFGLDEVTLRGGPQDPVEVTDLWRKSLTFLSSIAARTGTRPMLWGDMALAPDEAADAANAPDRETAAARRRAIPQNALIADWHYKADAKPATFVRSLQTWRNAGFRPIAAAWSRPENVRGLNLAADLERAGTLQTTWAGTDSSEASMLNAMEQFSPMVLAADYSWSGRQDSLDRLGYDPVEVFRRMYFDPPTPLRPVAGIALSLASGGTGAGSTAPLPEALELTRRTGVAFTPLATPIAFRTLETDGPLQAELSLGAPVPAGRLYIQASAATRLALGDPMARIRVLLAGGKTVETTVRYGLDVVGPGDLAPTRRSPSFGGLSQISLDLPAGAKVIGISVVASAPQAGLVLRAVTFR